MQSKIALINSFTPLDKEFFKSLIMVSLIAIIEAV